MNALVRAAMQTPALRQRRVWFYPRWLPSAIVLGGAAAAATAVFYSLPLAIVSMLVTVVAWTQGPQRSREAIRLNNAAVAARGAGDMAKAETLFAAALAHGGTTLLACIVFENLAGLALRRGDFSDAATLARAALALAPARRNDRRNDHRVRPQGTLAMALACSGDLDEAERVLASAVVPSARARERIFLLSAQIMVAFRRSRFDEVIALLDANRALVRNAFAADTCALLEAIESLALQRLGGAYRGVPRRNAQLPYDASTRAYVDTLVPGGAACLQPLAAP